MQYHVCQQQGPFEVYKNETTDERNSQGIGWYVECTRDLGIGPIYFCPFCGEKL